MKEKHKTSCFWKNLGAYNSVTSHAINSATSSEISKFSNNGSKGRLF
jgi:hypothetical protein